MADISNESLIWLIAAVAAVLAIGLLMLRGTARRPAKPIVEAEAPPADLPGAVPVGVADDRALNAIGVPVAEGPPDDLRRIKGIGPKLVTMLHGLEITRYDQIAAWSVADTEKVDAHLGSFKGRIARDNWVEQAGLLAGGRIAEYEDKFGKLGGGVA